MIESRPIRVLTLAAAVFLGGNTIYVHYRQRQDAAAGFGGVVIDRGISFSLLRHDFPHYLILRHADGTREKRYVDGHDYLFVSKGDSIEKLPGELRVRVVRPAHT